MGQLANFKGVNRHCKFMRRLAIIDGKERRYRMVLLNNGNYCFQMATDISGDDSEEEDDDDGDDNEDEEDAPGPLPPPAAPKNKKRAAAPKVAEPSAAEGASSSIEVPAKRSRKQVQRD